MMRRYRITHLTSLVYDAPVFASHNELRMTPVNEAGQTTLENRIRIRPLTWSQVYRDHWGTHVTVMESLSEHSRLEVEAVSTVETSRDGAPGESSGWEGVQHPKVQDRSYEWLMQSDRTRPGDGIADLVASVRAEANPSSAAWALGDKIRGHLKYEQGVTGVHSSGEDAWSEGRGVCQDFAHVMLGALRGLGVPARYVSGYLVPNPDIEIGQTVEGESHAWVEFWDGSWHHLDPTNGVAVATEHVVVARGRDYEDVSPFKGAYSGSGVADLEVNVEFVRLA
ncbi:MAG: transglutaminase family protein [Actinomycetia bacterium]|nr:transglutaminase family protein [Actinomycetes bacterium]